MKFLTTKSVSALFAVWLATLSFNAQADPITICHNIGPGEETLVFDDGIIPDGHQDHINNGTDAIGSCDDVGDLDEDGVPNGSDLCPNEAPVVDEDNDGCEDMGGDGDGDGDSGDFTNSLDCDDVLDTAGCIDPDVAVLKIRANKKMVWKWKGEIADFAAATGTPAAAESLDAYVICAYLNPDEVRGSDLPAGAFDKPTKQGWKTKTSKDLLTVKKHVYKSKSGVPGGVKKAVLKNKTKAGKDVVKVVSLFPPVLPLSTEGEDTVVVQLRNPTTGLCLQSTHVEPFKKSDAKRFKDKVVAVPPPLDSDGDGVPDDIDECPDTPAETEVDALGCPL